MQVVEFNVRYGTYGCQYNVYWSNPRYQIDSYNMPRDAIFFFFFFFLGGGWGVGGGGGAVLAWLFRVRSLDQH